MPSFSPYHKLQYSNLLERLIVGLRDSSNISVEAFHGHERYHTALIYKLKCAHYHIECLESKLRNTGAAEAATNTAEFMFEVNMSIDGFFHSGVSALDILARELLIYYNIKPPGSVYYNTAKKLIGSSHPGNSILKHLDDPKWLKMFRDYRNVSTHELILGTNYQICINTMSPTAHYINYPLPDNPANEPSKWTYKNNECNVLTYTVRHFRRILSCINTIYKEVYDQAGAKGSLPF